MRILFCCPTPATLALGASKVYVEAAEAFRRNGWDSDVVDPADVALGQPGDIFSQPYHLREYLRQNAGLYDVVEYEHNRLPFPRSDFPAGPLFVARSVLLTQVVTSVYIPPRPFLRSRVGRILKRWKVRRYERKVLDQSEITMANADLINVCNTLERDVLSRAGYPEDKLHVFPFGLFSERFAAFDRHSAEIAKQPIVAFIGTFDPRKGMLELPAILAKLVSRIPNVRLRLLGTAGMVPDADSVREYFPRSLWPGLEIHARYDPAELPDLLAGVSAGVFPSRVEGFPFSVLEMLAAGLPVFAYRAPGADMMLSEDFLVRVGDAKEMANRVADLLGNPDRLAAARKCARARAGDFRWEEIAAQTAEIYQRRLARSELV